VISGLETTATVTVPVVLLLPLEVPLEPLEPPPLEQAAISAASATALHAPPSLRVLNLMNDLHTDEVVPESLP